MDTNSFINQVKSYRKSTLDKALQLNSFAKGGPTNQIPPYITSDYDEYVSRKQAYADSLAQNQYYNEFQKIKNGTTNEEALKFAGKYHNFLPIDRTTTDNPSSVVGYASDIFYGDYGVPEYEVKGDVHLDHPMKPKSGVKTIPTKPIIAANGDGVWVVFNREPVYSQKPKQQVVYQEKPKTYNYEISREVQYPNTQSARIWRILTNNNEYNLNPNEKDYPVDPRYKGINDTVTEVERNAWNQRFNIEPYTKEMTEEEAKELEKQGYTVRRYDFGGEVYGHDPLRKVVKSALKKAYRKANKEGFEGNFRDAWKNRDKYELYDEEFTLGGPIQQFLEGGRMDKRTPIQKEQQPVDNTKTSLPFMPKNLNEELIPLSGQGTEQEPYLLEPITINPRKDQTVEYVNYNNRSKENLENKQKYNRTFTDANIDKIAQYERFEPTAGFSPIDFFLNSSLGNGAIGEQNERWKAYLHLNNILPVNNGYYLTTPREKEAIRQYVDTANLKEIYDNYDYYNNKYKLSLPREKVKELLDQGKEIINNPNKPFVVNGDYSLIKNSTADGTNETTSPLGAYRNFTLKWDDKNNNIIVRDTYDFPSYAHILGDIPDYDNTAPIINDTIDYDPHKRSNLIFYQKNKDALPESIHSGHEILPF